MRMNAENEMDLQDAVDVRGHDPWILARLERIGE